MECLVAEIGDIHLIVAPLQLVLSGRCNGPQL